MVGDIVGICSTCGQPIVETEEAFTCETNVGVLCEDASKEYWMHDEISKRCTERYGGLPLDTQDARALFDGQSIIIQLKSKKTGKFYKKRMVYDRENHRGDILWSESVW